MKRRISQILIGFFGPSDRPDLAGCMRRPWRASAWQGVSQRNLAIMRRQNSGKTRPSKLQFSFPPGITNQPTFGSSEAVHHQTRALRHLSNSPLSFAFCNYPPTSPFLWFSFPTYNTYAQNVSQRHAFGAPRPERRPTVGNSRSS